MKIITPYRFGGTASSLLTGLVSWWSLDETSGTRVDLHGSNDLTDNNTVTYNTGEVSNAAEFDAANSEYLNVVAPHGLQGGDRDYSIAFWVRPTTASLGSNRTYASCAAGATGSTFDYFVGHNSSANRFFINIGNGAFNRLDANNHGAPSGDTWAFIVAYYQASDNSYGISVNDGTFNTGTITGTPNTAGGAFHLGAWISGTQHMTGRLDEVGFWTKVLSASEITELYNAGNGISYPG